MNYRWRKSLFLCLLMAAIVVFAAMRQMQTGTTDEMASKGAAAIKIVSINIRSPKVMADTGMIIELLKEINKHPTNDQITLRWFVPQSGSLTFDGCDDELTYNRKEGKLAYSSHIGVLCDVMRFSDVTDKAIGIAAKEEPRLSKVSNLQHATNRKEHWARALWKAGCKVDFTNFD